VLVVVVAAGLGSEAAAKGGHRATPDLSTRHGVAVYLRSLGLNPAGFVIQRGARNYAGPACPGKRWNCTKATRVVQIAKSGARATANVADCGGALDVNVVQTASSGGNSFTCNQSTSQNSESVVLVQKTSSTGKTVNKNIASITQSISQSGTAGTQTGTQVAKITQNNDSGPNQNTLSQSINQSFNDDPTQTISQSQTASQTFAVSQCALSQTIQDSGNPSCDTTSPPVMKGSASSSVTQSVSQTANANAATAGSQYQESTMDGHVHQWNNSNATSSVSQSENQQLYALGSGVLQTQKGPMGVTPSKHLSRGRALAGGLSCCSNQGTNPSDTFSVTQSSSQHATSGTQAAAVALAPFLASVQPSGPNWHSDELQTAICEQVSGSCTRSQSENGNGATVTGNGTKKNFCSNGVCSDGQNIAAAVSPTTDTVPVSGGTATVGAHLVRSDTNAVLPGQDVTFTINGTPMCTARTQTDGNASCTLALTPGSYSINRSFAGAGPFEPSSVDGTLIVFAYLSQGAFVISDANAVVGPGTVTFFSTKNWPPLNPLTPSAPNSFQGFADLLSWTPPTCPTSGTWTLTGNVPLPVGPLPSYMAVLATTSVSKTGSSITGNVTKIVVVQTGSYTLGSSGTGTGTVVRVAC